MERRKRVNILKRLQMKKLILSIFISLILIGCTSTQKENINYYKVESFTFSRVMANVHATGNIHSYLGYVNNYEMELVSEEGDTIYESFVTERVLQFLPGDTIFFHNMCWKLKNSGK